MKLNSELSTKLVTQYFQPVDVQYSLKKQKPEVQSEGVKYIT